ncbi:unnamed protein product [Ectocarpus sp. 12 AP-2014]
MYRTAHPRARRTCDENTHTTHEHTAVVNSSKNRVFVHIPEYTFKHRQPLSLFDQDKNLKHAPACCCAAPSDLHCCVLTCNTASFSERPSLRRLKSSIRTILDYNWVQTSPFFGFSSCTDV